MIALPAFAAAAFVQAGWAAPTPPESHAPNPPRVTRFVSDANYPAEALRRGEQGIVYFQLTISSEGRVSECLVTQSSGSVTLDRATCEIWRTRALFSPARDAEGHPVADTVRSRMRWVLPR